MNTRAPAPLTMAFGLLLAAASLTACSSTNGGPGPVAPVALTPLDQYPMRVTQVPEEVALAAHAGGLSPNQRESLARFADHWRESGGEPIVVRSPTGGPDAAMAAGVARQTLSTLAALGVPGSKLRLISYAGGPGAPVVAGFARLAPDVPDCSQRFDDLARTGQNKVTGAFGCSVTSNMAMMIADPREILRPHAVESADGMRRGVVLGKYRDGKLTSSDRDDQAKGTLATAIGK